jgi:hypothetical protein
MPAATNLRKRMRCKRRRQDQGDAARHGEGAAATCTSRKRKGDGRVEIFQLENITDNRCQTPYVEGLGRRRVTFRLHNVFCLARAHARQRFTLTTSGAGGVVCDTNEH